MKSLKILAGTLNPRRDLAIVPHGLYLNNRLERMGEDTLLTFVDGWRTTKVLLVAKTRISLNTAFGTFIIHYICGGNRSLEWLTEEWDLACVRCGIGKGAYSTDDVWLIWHREYDKGMWEREQAEKRRKEEAIAAALEKERIKKEKEEERRRFIESIPRQIETGKFTHPAIKK